MSVPNARHTKNDNYYTPAWVVKLIAPYVPQTSIVWDPACGEGDILNALKEFRNFDIIGSDIEDGAHFDFLKSGSERVLGAAFSKRQTTFFEISSLVAEARLRSTVIITNPPYSKKDEFIQRALDLDVPFAMLLPISSLEGKTRSELWRAAENLSLLIPNKRVEFTGGAGRVNFASAWFCSGFDIPNALNFIDVR